MSKLRARIAASAATALAFSALVIAPAAAVPAPATARLTVGPHGFVDNPNLTHNGPITVSGTGMMTNGNRYLSLYVCASDPFVLTSGYVATSGVHWKTACGQMATNITANNAGAFTYSGTISRTFTTSQGGTAHDCATALFPGFADSAQGRPGACGIYAVMVKKDGQSGKEQYELETSYFAPISFSGTYPCFGLVPTTVGTFYDDTIDLSATTERQIVVDPYGDNSIKLGAGNDVVCTGAGTDTIQGGAGRDVVDAGPGLDFVAGGAFLDGNGRTTPESCAATGTGNDQLIGGAGNDVVNGCDGTNRLWGTSGNDDLYSGPTAGTLDGGGAPGDLCHLQGPPANFTTTGCTVS